MTDSECSDSQPIKRGNAKNKPVPAIGNKKITIAKATKKSRSGVNAPDNNSDSDDNTGYIVKNYPNKKNR